MFKIGLAVTADFAMEPYILKYVFLFSQEILHAIDGLWDQAQPVHQNSEQLQHTN